MGVCSNRLIPAVLYEWREPKHEEVQSATNWRIRQRLQRKCDEEDSGRDWADRRGRRLELDGVQRRHDGSAGSTFLLTINNSNAGSFGAAALADYSKLTLGTGVTETLAGIISATTGTTKGDPCSGDHFSH